jgi:tetratricopeptide (TPR) repeat protein
MGDGHALLLFGSFLPIDLDSYGIKEWLAILGSLVGIGGSVYGAWRTYRYSKSQIAQRLLEYLRDEEEQIKRARKEVVRQLRYPEQMTGDADHIFHREMRDILIRLRRNDIGQAERALEDFAEAIARDVRVGQKYIANLDLQMATTLLIQGRIAKDRSEGTAARSAWDEAIRRYSQDAESARYLGELDLAAGDLDSAVGHFNQAIAAQPDDKLLYAEISESLATFHRKRGSPTGEITELAKCAPSFAEVGAHERAASGYARAAEIAVQLGRTRQGPQYLRDAFASYKLSGDRGHMIEMRTRLETLGEDVSALVVSTPSWTQRIPWLLIRVGTELLLISVALWVFYLSLR